MPKQTRLGDNAELYQPRKVQTEKEKLHDLTGKKRITYLWEYYRIHALVTIAVVGLASYIIYGIVTPDIETKLYVAIVNNSIDDQVLTDYAGKMTEYLQLNPEKENVLINSSFYFNSTPDYSMNMKQILTTMVSAQEIDVFIAPESEFKTHAYYGFFDKLSEQLPTDLYSAMTDRFYLSDLEDNPEKSVYGIYLTDTDLFKNNARNDDPYVLGIIANSKHKNNAIELIRYLFQSFP